MAKPNAQKDNKPAKDDALDARVEKKELDPNLKMVIINIVTTLLVCMIFVCVNYVLQENLLGSKLQEVVAQDSEEEQATEEEEVVEKGIIVDLGDFVLNLSDADSKRYLKANVALELSRMPSDPDPNAKEEASGGGHGGHGGGEAANPMAAIEAEMAQYKPAIRDVIITDLSSKTSSEVATTSGKELVKEQIAQDVNAIFAGTREVIRVSFGQFIIQ